LLLLWNFHFHTPHRRFLASRANRGITLRLIPVEILGFIMLLPLKICFPLHKIFTLSHVHNLLLEGHIIQDGQSSYEEIIIFHWGEALTIHIRQSPIPPMWKKEGLIHSYLEKERSQVGPKKREKATRFRHFFFSRHPCNVVQRLYHLPLPEQLTLILKRI